MKATYKGEFSLTSSTRTCLLSWFLILICEIDLDLNMLLDSKKEFLQPPVQTKSVVALRRSHTTRGTRESFSRGREVGPEPRVEWVGMSISGESSMNKGTALGTW